MRGHSIVEDVVPYDQGGFGFSDGESGVELRVSSKTWIPEGDSTLEWF